MQTDWSKEMAELENVGCGSSFQVVTDSLKVGNRAEAIDLFEQGLVFFERQGGKLVDEALALHKMASVLGDMGYSKDAGIFRKRAQALVDHVVADHLSVIAQGSPQQPGKIQAG